MNATVSPLPFRVVRRWVRLYTTGLPPDTRDGRREEIDADLWEQAWEATLMRRPTSTLGSQVVLRLLLGIPADVTWRIEQIGAHQRGETATERRGTMQAIRRSSNVTRVAVVSTVVFAAIGLGLLGEGIATSWSGDYGALGVPLSAFLFTTPIVTLVGLGITNRSPVLGGALAAVGALSMAGMMYWMLEWTMPWTVEIPILALAVGVLGVIRARRAMRS